VWVEHMAGNAGVMTGMRWRASGGYDWCCQQRNEAMREHTHCRIPHAESKLGQLMLLQHDGPWPLPFVHEVEELGQDGRSAGHGVELAYARNHDSPCDTAGVAKNRAVYRAPVCPELDSAQRISEVAALWYRREQLLDHPSAVHATNGRLFQMAQHRLVDRLQLLGHRRHGGHRRKEQIQAHAAVLHLDDGHVGILDRHELADVFCVGQLPEDRREDLEEVLDKDMLGHDDEGVDVGRWAVNTKGVAAEEEDLTARNVQRRLRNALELAGAADKLLDDFLHVSQHFFSALVTLERLEDIQTSQRLDEVVVEFVVCLSGRRL
jgi:hypothetical protein